MNIIIDLSEKMAFNRTNRKTLNKHNLAAMGTAEGKENPHKETKRHLAYGVTMMAQLKDIIPLLETIQKFASFH